MSVLDKHVRRITSTRETALANSEYTESVQFIISRRATNSFKQAERVTGMEIMSPRQLKESLESHWADPISESFRGLVCLSTTREDRE